MKMFEVVRKADWQPVADYLLANAGAVPVLPDVYSKTEEEAGKRAERLVAAGYAEEALKYTIVVLYRQTTMISVVLTREPTHLHLSMSRVEPLTASMQPLADAIAKEAADHLLGNDYEERKEGVMPTVRHYFQKAGPILPPT